MSIFTFYSILFAHLVERRPVMTLFNIRQSPSKFLLHLRSISESKQCFRYLLLKKYNFIYCFLVQKFLDYPPN